jgi:hypothetical protein
MGLEAIVADFDVVRLSMKVELAEIMGLMVMLKH